MPKSEPNDDPISASQRPEPRARSVRPAKPRNAQRRPAGSPPEKSEGRPYDRLRDLPGLIPMWPEELRTPSLSAQLRFVVLLRKALREERRRGLAGHWTYSLTRHAGLLAAYRAERASLEALADGEAGTVAMAPQHTPSHPAGTRH